jgi:predicted small secreted protein
MRSIRQARRSFFLAGVLVAVLAFVLAACGTNTGAGTGSSAPSTTPGAGSSQTGCPSSTVMNTAPSAANIVLNPSNNNSTVTASVGDVIEVDLPFGQAWTGPNVSQGQLTLQQPAGFSLTPSKVCVWRFTAQSTGTTQLEFYGRAICQKGQACPLYIMHLPYTIVTK